jgi:hypothetical protein
VKGGDNAVPRVIVAKAPPVVWTVVAPLVVALGYWWFRALDGFNPTDDGFVLAQSWRVLQGQTIHVDFTSPRPMGSAFLHVPDVLSPWGTLAISRLIVVLQQMWIASATVAMVDVGRRLTPVQRFLLVVLAFALNTGVWPVMAWHTIDGIFVGITALWLTQRGPLEGRGAQLRYLAAWLLAGTAPLMKQGFLLVPVFVALLLVVSGQRRGLFFAPVALVSPLAYLAAADGEWALIADQLYRGKTSELLIPVQQFWSVVASDIGLATVALTAVVCAVTLRPWSMVARRPLARSLGAAVLVAPTAMVGAADGFAIGVPRWAFIAAITLTTVGIWLLGCWRQVALAVTLLGLAYAASASWGVQGPGLLAGSMVATASGFVLLGSEQRADSQSAMAAVRGAALVLAVPAVVVGVLVLAAFDRSVYREGPRSGIVATSELPSLAGIRMTEQSASFLARLDECVDDAGTTTVALIPGGAGIYPLLRVTSPFDVDWWLPVEYPPDIGLRTGVDIGRLNAESDWLVLFQRYDLLVLAKMPIEEVHAPTERPRPGLGRGLADEFEVLRGQMIDCGSMSGVYRPPRT